MAMWGPCWQLRMNVDEISTKCSAHRSQERDELPYPRSHVPLAWVTGPSGTEVG